MSRNGITFMGLFFVVAAVNGQILLAIFGIMTLFLGWMGAMVFFKVLQRVGNGAPTGFIASGYEMIRPDKKYTIATLNPDLLQAERQVIQKIAGPGETIDEIYKNFCYHIGVLKEGQALPNYFSRVIMQRILFCYYKKHGDLRHRFLNKNRLEVDDIVKPMDDTERQNFHHFCISHS